MFSKRIELLRQNTAVDLTLRFALLFLLSAVVLYFTVQFLLSGAQLEKDQQQITAHQAKGQVFGINNEGMSFLQESFQYRAVRPA